MRSQLITSHDAFRIDGQYEFDSNIGYDELSLFLLSMQSMPSVSFFTINQCKMKLETSIKDYMDIYLPDFNLEERLISTHYEFDVIVMGLFKTNNGRCHDGKCGKYVMIGDSVVFEEAIIEYKGSAQPSVAVVKVHDDESRCRVGFVRTGDYGGINMCTRWLMSSKGIIGELYADSKNKEQRKDGYRNCGMASIINLTSF